MKYESNGRHVAFFQASLLRNDLGTAEMKGFEEFNAKLNRLAEEGNYIVYRFKDEKTNDGLSYRVFEGNPRIISQVLVSRKVADLFAYGHHTLHQRIKEKFGDKYFDRDGLRKILQKTSVLWFVNPGTQPNLYDGKERLNKLINDGSSEEVFTFEDIMGGCPHKVQKIHSN